MGLNLSRQLAMSSALAAALGVLPLALWASNPLQAATVPLGPISPALVVAGGLILAGTVGGALGLLVGRRFVKELAPVSEAARRLAGAELELPSAGPGEGPVGPVARAIAEAALAAQSRIATLEDERAGLAAVVEHMADGLMIADQASIVRLINPAAARLLGLRPSDAEGRSIIEVLRDHELASLVAETVTTDAGVAGPRLIELSSHRANRAVRTIASRVPALRGAGHRVVLLLQDVTELQRAETIRREFVANVSHELRTPVAALKALVETLEDGAIDDRPAALDFLHRMRIEVDGLAQLVEELLQLSRIEAGQLPLRLLPVDLSAVVLAAVERLRQQAERAHVELHVEATEGLPPARADPDRIHQIVLNLVHNALKFTPPGGRVAVQVCAVPEGLAVRVADTGIGIAAETQPRLFERFYKADSARSSGGTGLGLAIAKHLVQAHGGQIGVESPGEGRGATFTFTIPIAKDG